LFSCLACAGCTAINAYEDPPIVGKWAGTTDSRNAMIAKVEGEGEVVLHYQFTNDPAMTPHQDHFEMEWEYEDDHNFQLKFRCIESTAMDGCADNDPAVLCEINNDGDKMGCATEHPLWMGYTIDWSAD
jgi:hypothetical protein